MTQRGRCHCGATAFELEAPPPARLTRCTCSFCTRRGVLWTYADPPQFRLRREAQPGVYRWRPRLIAHHFCAGCGCGTYSVSPAFGEDGTWDGVAERIGVNARLLEDFDAAAQPVEVLRMDGEEGYPPRPSGP